MPQIILIGGSSSTGKTTLASALGKSYARDCVHLDDFTKAIDDPDLVFFEDREDFWDQPAQVLFERLVRVTENTEPHLQKLISGWLAEEKSGIIEGEKIHPQFVERMSSKLVTGIFLIETDRERLYQTLHGRSKRFRALTNAQQWKVVEVNQYYGLWLMQEAEKRNLVWEFCQPWETLVSRINHRLQLS